MGIEFETKKQSIENVEEENECVLLLVNRINKTQD